MITHLRQIQIVGDDLHLLQGEGIRILQDTAVTGYQRESIEIQPPTIAPTHVREEVCRPIPRSYIHDEGVTLRDLIDLEVGGGAVHYDLSAV